MSGLGALALIVNPSATTARHDRRAQLARMLSPLGLEWSLATGGPGHAAQLARRAAEEGARVVVTLGGDGTVAEVAGALAGGPVVMVPMPGGNANVFGRALGWPAGWTQALAALGAALEGGAVREVTLGRLRFGGGERVFVINAGMGIDAATVEWVEARPRTKRYLRHAGFALAAARASVRAGREPRLWAAVDGGAEIESIAVLVACGWPYAYLGRRPLDLVPGAAFDGHPAWVALAPTCPAALGGLLLRAAAGRALDLGGPAVNGGALGAELIVRAERPAPLQADGEPLGRHTRVAISHGPRLWVLEPPRGAGLKSGAAPPT